MKLFQFYGSSGNASFNMVLLPDKSIRKKSRKISSRNSLQVVPAAALHCSRRAEDQSGRSRLKPYGKGRGGRFVTRHILFHFLANLSMQKKRFEGSKATCGHASIAAGNAPPSVPAKENNIRIGHGASTAAEKKKKKKNQQAAGRSVQLLSCAGRKQGRPCSHNAGPDVQKDFPVR